MIDIESRLEAALLQTSAAGTSRQAEEALALWRMHEATQALGNYVLATKGDAAKAGGPVTEQLRARLMSEIEKLRDFDSRRRFPDQSASNHVRLFDGLL